MRVVHLLRKYNPTEWGGTETAIHRLVEGLQHHQVTSVVYAPKIDDSIRARDPLAACCELKRFKAFVPIWRMPEHEKRQLISVGGNLMSFELIGSLRREPDPSVIHTHTLGRIGAIGRTFARRHKVPFVVTIHGGLLDLPEKVKRSFQQPQLHGWDWGKIFGLLLGSRGLLEDADAIITCNPTEAKLLQEKMSNKRIHIQPHGVVLTNFRENHRTAALAAFPQIREHEILLSVGRIDPVKNQAWLVEQLPAVLKQHPRTMLVLAGACTDEKYGKLVEKKIAELGLGNHVLLTGGLPPNDPRLVGLMQSATAVILPSISETFGLVLLEAWAAGTAVISSRTSGASALIQNGENGWLFDLERPESFQCAVHETLTRPDWRTQSIARGAQLVASNYDTVTLAGRIKQLYDELKEKYALRHSTR